MTYEQTFTWLQSRLVGKLLPEPAEAWITPMTYDGHDGKAIQIKVPLGYDISAEPAVAFLRWMEEEARIFLRRRVEFRFTRHVVARRDPEPGPPLEL